jgi:hypothetical protein
LSSDPTLKAEVEYDLKQYEKQKKQQQLAAADQAVEGSGKIYADHARMLSNMPRCII